MSPIDGELRITAPKKDPTRILLVGGPFGMRPYVLPHEPTVAFRIVMFTDPHGSKLSRPIVYEVRGQRDGEWWAGHAGFAGSDDIALWKKGPK